MREHPACSEWRWPLGAAGSAAAGGATEEGTGGANDFIFCGTGGAIATNRFEDQEMAMLSLHLLKISLVSINTLMMQHALSERVWLDRMASDDCGLSPRASPSISPPIGRSSWTCMSSLNVEAALNALPEKLFQRLCRC